MLHRWPFKLRLIRPNLGFEVAEVVGHLVGYPLRHAARFGLPGLQVLSLKQAAQIDHGLRGLAVGVAKLQPYLLPLLVHLIR